MTFIGREVEVVTRRGLLVGMALLVVPVGAADKKQPEKRDPKSLGRVVILPFLDISGERQEDKDEYRLTALDEVEERFRKHEIAYFGRDELGAALKALDLVPTDPEDRTRARLKELADHLKARWVVTGTILDSDSDFRTRGTFGGARKTGQAKVFFQALDAESGRYAEDLELTATSTARAKGFSSGLFSRSNKLRVKAVRDATKKSMARFMAPYPKMHDDDPGEKK